MKLKRTYSLIESHCQYSSKIRADIEFFILLLNKILYLISKSVIGFKV